MKGIYVPMMHEKLTTARVLVMEWVDGRRLNNEEHQIQQDDLKLVNIGVRCSLEQMLEEGFYHADPHPGDY